MNFFERRRWYKTVRHLLHEATHARRMREDIASPGDLAALRAAEADLREAWRERDRPAMEKAAERVADCVDAVLPPKHSPRFREHVEIFAVAIILAMAVRTYFVQPFKIPTGSMQPTLYGVWTIPQEGKRLGDYFPVNLLTLALYGERYVEIRARASGTVTTYHEPALEDEERFYIAGVPHLVKRNMKTYFIPGVTRVEKGQLIASGRVRYGDHIFVNKVRYNFSRPRRGDIFVFSTDGIPDPRVQSRGKGTFYIKRLVGLPNEDVSISQPYVVVNGKPVEDPYPFRRQVHRTDLGYYGYTFATMMPSYLNSPRAHIRLGPDHYLPFGDNTTASLDGRFFGPVEWKYVVGPAFMVYWPLGKRWGWWVDSEKSPWR